MISDNGKQFIDKGFEKFLGNLGIKHRATSIEHPQSNAQIEAANKVKLGEVKKRVGKAKGNWAEELLAIL